MFICPNCQHKSIDIVMAVNLKPTGDWDEIEFQLVKCNDCPTFAVASYRDERHGSLDRDYSSHEGIIVTQKAWEKLKAKLNSFWCWRTHSWLNSKEGNIWDVAEELSDDFDPDKVQHFKLKLS